MTVRLALAGACAVLLAVVVGLAARTWGLLWTGVALAALGSAAIYVVRRRNPNARRDTR